MSLDPTPTAPGPRPDPEPTPSRRTLANQKNAMRSTGPRTPEGKSRSRSNAWKHGLRAGTIVTQAEREAVDHQLGRYTEEVGISYVVPDDKRIQRNVMIPQDARNGARPGQLVVAEITTPPDAHRPPIGRVLAVLGDKLTA